MMWSNSFLPLHDDNNNCYVILHELQLIRLCLSVQNLCTQIYIWDDSKDHLVKNLKVAGEVASLDVWNDYIAVGSGAVQLIDIADNSKRVQYMKRERRVSVQYNCVIYSRCILKLRHRVIII